MTRQPKKRWRDMPWRYRFIYIHSCRWSKICGHRKRTTIWLAGLVVYKPKYYED